MEGVPGNKYFLLLLAAFASVISAQGTASLQCTQDAKNAAASCFDKQSSFMPSENACQMMQHYVSCYVSNGCGGIVKTACQGAKVKGCWQLQCSDPLMKFDVVAEKDHRTTIYIKNGTQFVMVDIGMTDADADLNLKEIDKLLTEGLKFRAMFITHVHADEPPFALWKINQKYPTVPIYVGSSGAKQEMITIMYLMGPKLPKDSPGNPVGTVPEKDKFKWQEQLQVLWSVYDLWGSRDVVVLRDFYEVAETAHFSVVSIPSANTLVTGDVVFYDYHPNLAGVELEGVCEWIQVLTKLSNLVDSRTTLYVGQALTVTQSAATVMKRDIEYLQSFRKNCIKTCDRQIAEFALTAPSAYPNWGKKNWLDNSLLWAVPRYAKQYGCDCGSDPSSPTVTCPPFTPPLYPPVIPPDCPLPHV